MVLFVPVHPAAGPAAAAAAPNIDALRRGDTAEVITEIQRQKDVDREYRSIPIDMRNNIGALNFPIDRGDLLTGRTIALSETVEKISRAPQHDILLNKDKEHESSIGNNIIKINKELLTINGIINELTKIENDTKTRHPIWEVLNEEVMPLINLHPINKKIYQHVLNVDLPRYDTKFTNFHDYVKLSSG